MLWSTLAIGRAAGRWTWRIAMAAWVIMALVQVELVILHPMMDRLIDINAHAILNGNEFYWLHAIYMGSATVQWAAGLIHIWCTVSGQGGKGTLECSGNGDDGGGTVAP